MTPKKLDNKSVEGNKLNLEALYAIAPSCFTEVKDPQTGETKHVVDFDTLRTLLGDDAVETNREMYQFTWPGKQAARLEAATETTETLLPVPKDSLNWDTTQNVYIEGDNLRVLKLLQKSYMGKVKMIYIDPPYNTGKDFVYHDDFKRTTSEEELAAGNIDEEGRRYRKNTDSNGRFHSDWCSMMYSRLLVAHSLLAEDGVIFISIDDNEVHNLRKICDEVFGEKNLLGQITTINNLKGRSDANFFAPANEFLIVYAKSKEEASIAGFEISDEEVDNDYDKVDDIGYYKLVGLRKTGNAWKREERPRMFYPILVKDDTFSTVSKSEYWQIYDDNKGVFNDQLVDDITNKYRDLGYQVFWPTTTDGQLGRWRWGIDTFLEQKDFNLGLNSSMTVCSKMRASMENGSIRMKTAKTIWYKPEYDTGSSGILLKQIFEGLLLFDNPKSLVYLTDIIRIATSPDSLILDFFSGSATTAHAVMQLNAEDLNAGKEGKRKYICVQLAEEPPKDSEARKAGYTTIPEIAKERIRRAGKKIKEEHPEVGDRLDTGFRVFRLDSSNFKEMSLAPKDYDQEQLDLFVDNIKGGRTDLDLLFGALLSWGVPLSLSQPLQTVDVDGYTIYNVTDGELVACFAEQVTEAVVRTMAEMKPERVLFRDSCFDEDKTKINIFEQLKQDLGWDEREALDNIRVI